MTRYGWTASTGGPAGYHVQLADCRSCEWESFTNVNTNSVLVAGTAGNLRVQAYKGSDVSEWSEPLYPVPEPAGSVMLGAGIVLLLILRRWR